jgi:hypothetical protein
MIALWTNYVNIGRLATIYCLIQLVWNLALRSPFGEVFREYTPMFQEALDEAIAEQATLVTKETEVAKFLAALNELTVTRPDLFMAGELRVGTEKILGRQNEEGLFVFPNETLAVMKQLGVFTQMPTRDSLTLALLEKKLILPSKEREHILYRTSFQKKRPRGWMLIPGWEDACET